MKKKKKLSTLVCCHGVTNECLQLSHPVKHNPQNQSMDPGGPCNTNWEPRITVLILGCCGHPTYQLSTYTVNKLQQLNLNPYIPKTLPKIIIKI